MQDLRFDVFVDYAGADNDPNSVEFIRIFFPRGSLTDPDSRVADFRNCRDILVREENGQQNLAIALMGDTSENACIVNQMAETDRALFRSLEWGLRDAIGQATGPGAKDLRDAFRIAEPERDGLQVGFVSISPATTEDRWKSFRLSLSMIELTGFDAPSNISGSLLADYDTSAKDSVDMNFLRFWVFRHTLRDQESREANYLDCPSIVAREMRGSQQIAVALLGDTRGNSCILGKMGPNDRALHTAILRDLPGIVSEQGSSSAARHIAEALARP